MVPLPFSSINGESNIRLDVSLVTQGRLAAQVPLGCMELSLFILPLILSLQDLKARSAVDEHQDLLPQFLVSITLYPTMRLLRLASTLSFVSLALAWTVYTVPYSGGNDDAPALNAALKSHPEYVTDVTILFKQGIKYNFNTPVYFPRLTNAIVSVQGNISYASNIAATQGTESNQNCATRVVDIGSRCSFPLEIVEYPQQSVGRAAPPKDLYMS